MAAEAKRGTGGLSPLPFGGQGIEKKIYHNFLSPATTGAPELEIQMGKTL